MTDLTIRIIFGVAIKYTVKNIHSWLIILLSELLSVFFSCVTDKHTVKNVHSRVIESVISGWHNDLLCDLMTFDLPLTPG